MSKGRNREKRKNNGTDAAQTTGNKNMMKTVGMGRGRGGGRRKGIKDYRMVTQVTAKMRSYSEDKLHHVFIEKQRERSVPFPHGNVLVYCFEMKGRGKWGLST